jgi:Ni,Fe-hydrogenase III large subunit/Ni,Fe-hydrogenase III component G
MNAADRIVGSAPDAERQLGGARAYRVEPARLRATVERAVAAGWRFAAIVADQRRPGVVDLDYVFVAPGGRVPIVLGSPAPAPSIALACPGASWAEREARDLHGVDFADMPDPRPLVHHEDWPPDVFPLRAGAAPELPVDRVDGQYPFRHVEGEGVMEVRVGPIHAGIIEPGHFRFSTVGETVLSLEIRLGFVHRGVEKVAVGMTPAQAIVLGERVSGTASVAHALALARALEAACGVAVPAEQALGRALLLELERIYNHAGDVGNLCAGTALSAVLAEGLVLRERLLGCQQQRFGSRALRGLVGLGGLRRVPPRADVKAALDEVDRVAADFERLVAKFFGSASNLERLTGTGVLTAEHARNLATVGVVARASGVATDSRVDLDGDPLGDVRVVTQTTGDVAARARVRVEELRESLRRCHVLAEALATANRAPAALPGRPDGEGLGWAEGARGEVMTYVRVEGGRIARLKVRSPSRMNWPAIEHAMPGNIVPDFPLINKSFNLSYAGCDL